MWTDPIVAETRKAREEFAARFNYEPEAIYRELKEREQRSGRRVVSLPMKPAARPGEARDGFVAGQARVQGHCSVQSG